MPQIEPTSWRGNVAAMLRQPALLVWAAMLLLTPFDVVHSGLPQPGDWLIVLLFPLTLLSWKRTLDREQGRVVRALFWFTVWVFVVNYGWALVMWRWTNRKDFILHPFFYLFNFLILLCSLILARADRKRFLRITVDAMFVTVVVQVAASFLMRGDFYRGQLFFNSPNQLGYYALLSACLFAMTQRPLGISRLRASLGVTCCAYLAVLSASRASVAGILALLFVLLFSSPRIIILATVAAIGLVSLGGPIATALETAQRRAVEDRDPKTSFAEERGYVRIWRFPEYMITGAGEGACERFISSPGEQPRELHSSFASVLFSYGIVGAVLFLIFALRVVRRAPLRMALMLVPALVYTVAHQGFRFTTFWVVLASFVILKTMPDSQPNAYARVPSAS